MAKAEGGITNVEGDITKEKGGGVKVEGSWPRWKTGVEEMWNFEGRISGQLGHEPWKSRLPPQREDVRRGTWRRESRFYDEGDYRISEIRLKLPARSRGRLAGGLGARSG